MMLFGRRRAGAEILGMVMGDKAVVTVMWDGCCLLGSTDERKNENCFLGLLKLNGSLMG